MTDRTVYTCVTFGTHRLPIRTTPTTQAPRSGRQVITDPGWVTVIHRGVRGSFNTSLAVYDVRRLGVMQLHLNIMAPANSTKRTHDDYVIKRGTIAPMTCLLLQNKISRYERRK